MADPVPSARVAGVSLDCADHRALGAFYAGLVNGTVSWSTDTATGVSAGGYSLVAQQVAGYAPPTWPGTAIVHLDITCDPADLPRLRDRAVSLGATPADYQPDPRWTVLFDPAGHPFCLTPLVG